MSAYFQRRLGVHATPRIELEDWALPYWYYKQNDPYAPIYAIGGNDFRNFCFRNWTTIRLKNAKTVSVDRFGIVYFPEARVSLEFWVYSDRQLYTSASYQSVSQRLVSNGSIQTVCDYVRNRFFVIISPYSENASNMDSELFGKHKSDEGFNYISPDEAMMNDYQANCGQISCKIGLICPQEDALKYYTLYCVIRPYDYNGLSAIYHLEYKNNFLWVNHRRLLFLEKEPKHCYFTNGLYGDVTKYLRAGSGNTKLLAPEGFGTGLIGFSGLPAELAEINLFFPTMKKMPGKGSRRGRNLGSPDVSDSLNRICSNTAVDQLLAANLQYLKGLNCLFNIYQILALNRYSDGFQSRLYLKECLKKVTWDGSLQVQSLSQEQLIWGIKDYYQLTMDVPFIEKHWPLLKRMGYAIWYQKAKPMLWMAKQIDRDQGGFYEKLFWMSGALSSLEKLAFLVGEGQESLIYKEENQIVIAHLNRLLTNCAKFTGKRVIPIRCQSGYGAGVIANLAAAYPLQIWKSGNSLIQATIHFIFKRLFHQGGIYSPFDFQGIDLAQSARFGQALVREGYDCTEIIELFLAAAGGTGSLPERIDPRTLNGIGENGHSPETIYQLLLLIRNIFVLEEDRDLELLPGFLNSKFWNRPTLRINRLNTFFGEISCNCRSIGDLIQIDFWPNYRIKPKIIRIRLSSDFYPVYVDAASSFNQSVLEVNSDFHRLRLKKRISAGLS